MIKIKDIQKIYFIGIGGIGMSALARYFKSLNKTVIGYDKTVTPLTLELEQSGIAIHYQDDVKLIPTDADVIVSHKLKNLLPFIIQHPKKKYF